MIDASEAYIDRFCCRVWGARRLLGRPETTRSRVGAVRLTFAQSRPGPCYAAEAISQAGMASGREAADRQRNAPPVRLREERGGEMQDDSPHRLFDPDRKLEEAVAKSRHLGVAIVRVAGLAREFLHQDVGGRGQLNAKLIGQER